MLFSICFFFFILSPISSFGQSSLKLRVVSTLFSLQEFARAVGGDRVQVDLLLPPGAEPHHWEPKPSEVAKIYQTDIFIYNGPAMEPWSQGQVLYFDILKSILSKIKIKDPWILFWAFDKFIIDSA